jgi:hypothetical protein
MASSLSFSMALTESLTRRSVYQVPPKYFAFFVVNKLGNMIQWNAFGSQISGVGWMVRGR